jgi:hypothetical protein
MPPQPEAPLLTAILLGVQTGIPEGAKNVSSATGTTQPITASGGSTLSKRYGSGVGFRVALLYEHESAAGESRGERREHGATPEDVEPT